MSGPLLQNPRRVAADALLRMEKDDAYSHIVVGHVLDRAELSPRDRRLAAALFYGVLTWRVALDFEIKQYSRLPMNKITPEALTVLRLGMLQLFFLERIPVSAAVDESVRLIKGYKQYGAAGFVNAVLRAAARSGGRTIPDYGRDRSLHLSVRYACPQWLVELWVRAYGEETAEALLAAGLTPPPTYARVNTLRTRAEDLALRLKSEEINASLDDVLSYALVIHPTGPLIDLPAFRDGLFHVQDRASQICCHVLAPCPGETVVDVCAAPGGKSFTMAQMMCGEGTLHAFDLHPGRVSLIEEGIRRLGIPNMTVRVRDALDPSETGICADAVLCDVPCSGLGTIAKKPDVRHKIPESLETLPDVQYNILCFSARMLHPGGRIVYSTCTLNPAENERVVERFLNEHPDFAPMPFQLPASFAGIGEVYGWHMTLMPHRSRSDGFFIALMEKKS